MGRGRGNAFLNDLCDADSLTLDFDTGLLMLAGAKGGNPLAKGSLQFGTCVSFCAPLFRPTRLMLAFGGWPFCTAEHYTPLAPEMPHASYAAFIFSTCNKETPTERFQLALLCSIVARPPQKYKKGTKKKRTKTNKQQKKERKRSSRTPPPPPPPPPPQTSGGGVSFRGSTWWMPAGAATPRAWTKARPRPAQS